MHFQTDEEEEEEEEEVKKRVCEAGSPPAALPSGPDRHVGVYGCSPGVGEQPAALLPSVLEIGLAA